MWVFAPKPDITAYELARCMPLLVKAAEYTLPEQTVAIANFPPEVARHWVDVPLAP